MKSYAIRTNSALRNGRPGIISGKFLACNAVHAYNTYEIKWFSTEMQAQKYIEMYLQKSENPVILINSEVLDAEYFK